MKTTKTPEEILEELEQVSDKLKQLGKEPYHNYNALMERYAPVAFMKLVADYEAKRSLELREKEQRLLQELEELLSGLGRKLDEVFQQKQEPIYAVDTKRNALSKKLKNRTRNVFLERGSDFLLDLTDAMYPIFIGVWAVVASSQIASLLHLFGAIYTGFNGGAVYKVVSKQLVRADMLIAEKKFRSAKREMITARAMLNQSLSSIIYIGLLLGMTFVVFAKPLLHCLGITHPDAVSYFQLAGGSYFLFTGVRWNLASHLHCVDRAKFAKRASLLIFSLNLVLDPILMFGMGWGLIGSALGTHIAQFVGICYMLYYIQRESMLWTIKASWRLTCSMQYELWINPGGLTMAREVTNRTFPFLLVYIINQQLGAAVLMAYRLWTAMYPPIASVGLAGGVNMQVQVAKLISEVQEVSKKWSSQAASVQLLSYRARYEQELKICQKDSRQLLIKRWLWASLIVVSLLAFVYLPSVNAGGEGYLFTFFVAGLFGWYQGSMNSLLEYTLHGAGKLKEIIIILFCNQTGCLLVTWMLLQLFSSEYLDIIVVAGMFSISMFSYGVLLGRVSKTVLRSIK